MVPVIHAEKIYLEKFKFKSIAPADTLIRWLEMPLLEDWVEQFSSTPLIYQPGQKHWYSHAHDVLGYLIEVLSGKKLDEFLRKTIFDKLEMQDTDFYVPEAKWDRVSKAFRLDESGELIQLSGKVNEGFKQKPEFLSGGGGLFSTITDYLKFCQMMLQGGTYNGINIVSRETLELMIQNHLPGNESILTYSYIKSEDPEFIKNNKGYGYRLGVRVKIEENITKESIGTHNWSGAMNTTYWVDPQNELITIMMTQYCPPDIKWEFNVDRIELRKLVYQSIKTE